MLYDCTLMEKKNEKKKKKIQLKLAILAIFDNFLDEIFLV